MLPLNIGLLKTPHGLYLDRCYEPCPSVIPNTDQPRLQPRPPSPDPVLPQCWPSQDYCSLVSVMGVKPKQLHQMAGTTNPSFGGCVIQRCCLWVILKITGGFQGYSPLSLLPSLSTIVSIFISRTIELEFSFEFKIKKGLG